MFNVYKLNLIYYLTNKFEEESKAILQTKHIHTIFTYLDLIVKERNECIHIGSKHKNCEMEIE